jgi:hypothetical protein
VLRYQTPRIEAHRNGALVPHQKLHKSAIEWNGMAAFRHFIAKTCSVKDGREDRKGTKNWCRGGAVALGEGSGDREDEPGR